MSAGLQRSHYRPSVPLRILNAIATLRERISEIWNEAAFMARSDPEAAATIRADADKLQAAIDVLERR